MTAGCPKSPESISIIPDPAASAEEEMYSKTLDPSSTTSQQHHHLLPSLVVLSDDVVNANNNNLSTVFNNPFTSDSSSNQEYSLAVCTAIFMGVMCVLGSVANTVLLLAFCRRPALRTNSNR